MATAAREIDAIRDWHVHVYFDQASRDAAWNLRERAARHFADAVAVGRFHERPVGPHPRWSFQLAFAPDRFDQVVPWMALNRGGLVVLVHPNTGDALGDHLDRALWMGETVALDTSVLTED